MKIEDIAAGRVRDGIKKERWTEEPGGIEDMRIAYIVLSVRRARVW